MAGDNPLLKFEPGLMIWTVLTFLLTFVALRLIAWKPLLGALDERERRIKDSLEKADRTRLEAERAMAEDKARSEEALRRSEELIAAAKQEAEQVRARVVEEARAESKKIVEQGLRRVEAEQRAASESIRRETAEIAVRAAERILEKNLDGPEQRRLVEDFLNELPDRPAR